MRSQDTEIEELVYLETYNRNTGTSVRFQLNFGCYFLEVASSRVWSEIVEVPSKNVGSLLGRVVLA